VWQRENDVEVRRGNSSAERAASPFCARVPLALGAVRLRHELKEMA